MEKTVNFLNNQRYIISQKWKQKKFLYYWFLCKTQSLVILVFITIILSVVWMLIVVASGANETEEMTAIFIICFVFFLELLYWWKIFIQKYFLVRKNTNRYKILMCPVENHKLKEYKMRYNKSHRFYEITKKLYFEKWC